MTDCRTCSAPRSEWPERDCETPGDHEGASRLCDCGDVVTVRDVLNSPTRHSRCSQIP